MNPSFSRSQALSMIKQAEQGLGVHLIGYRSASSKYGEYDDTIALIDSEEYLEVKGNTLPSVWRQGIAKLLPGDYKYTAGLHGMHHLTSSAGDQAILAWLDQHKGEDYPSSLIPVGKLIPYWAFRQSGPVTLIRDDSSTKETQTNPALYPFIDIHHGGFNLTSSEGCQTIFPSFWQNFRANAYAAMIKYNQPIVTYHLIQL
jgi:hypothetical protein